MARLRSPFTSLRDIELFAVGDTTAQLLIRTAATEVTVSVAGRDVRAAASSGVATAAIDELEPDAIHSVEISTTDLPGQTPFQIQTRPATGQVLSRFATISDVHLGLEKFGVVRRLVDHHDVPYALRCARAAIDEAIAWGAQLVVIKGDLTESGADNEWELAAELLQDIDVPVLFTPGNHDVWKSSHVPPGEGARSVGLDFAEVQTIDLPGVRVVLADTSRPGRGTGDMARMTTELVEVVDCRTPVVLAFHHNIQRAPVPWFWPPGISWSNARRTVAALEEANPRLFLTSGHTHRNRRHHLGSRGTLPYTEVSSTSDYPGVWAGYEVSASMIRQTVHRIASPDVLSWTERTRSVLGGVWPRWSQGRLDDRCVDLDL